MAKLSFVKGEGTGNDFVLYTDADGERPLTPEQIRAVCDRRFGVGADGVIRAVRTSAVPEARHLLEAEPDAEWFMDYWNADGTVAEMCGNGVRVYAHYLLQEGLASPERRDTLPIATRGGIKDVLAGVSGYSVDLGRWELGEPNRVSAAGLHIARQTQGVSLGNPHQVAVVASKDELQQIDLTKQPVLETPLPEGANIEFVTAGPQLVHDGQGHIEMRVYERGVGETLSCGTGAVASALAMRYWGGAEMPNVWRVDVPGGTLHVRMFPTEEGEHVSLQGPARLVYRGEIELAD